MMADDGAIILPAGADFVLQMHYHPTGKPEWDQTEVGLYFTDKKPTRNNNIVLLGSSDIDIRPGDRAYKVTDQFKLPVDTTVGSIWAHMHLIGKDVRVWAELPDGQKREMLWINDWDFNWQDTYLYHKPFRLPAGTVIRAEFIFDNTAANPRNPNNPPKRVLIGENSTDEMGGMVIGVETENGLANLALFASVVGHYFEMDGKGAKAKAEAEKVRKQQKEARREPVGMVLFRGGVSGGANLVVAFLRNPPATLLALMLAAGLFPITAALLLPGPTRRAAEKMRRAPGWCFVRAMAVSATLPLLALALLALALIFAPQPGAQVCGLLLLLYLLAASFVGAGGLMRLLTGRRIVSAAAKTLHRPTLLSAARTRAAAVSGSSASGCGDKTSAAMKPV